MLFILSLGALAFAVSLLMTPLVRDVFLRIGVVDMPDQERKLHGNNIPRVGGIAIFLAYTIAYAALALIPTKDNEVFRQAFDCKWWLFSAVTVVFLTGLLDDLLNLRPKHKLFGQIIAAVLAWCGGIEINLFPNAPFGQWLTLPLTIAWLIGCTNAFNLIDGLDGLAAGTGLCATLTVIAAALLTHNVGLALVTIPLAGSLLAFLCFNFNPASIFLGDCGSLTIGFLLGSFGMLWSQKITTLIGLSAPLMAFSIPLLDTSIAIARRVLRNRPIFSPDRGHIHHRLLDRGNSVRKTALLLYAACAVAAGLSLALQSSHGQFGTLVVALFGSLVYLGIQHLGYVEFRAARRLLSKRVMFRMIDDEMKLQHLENQLSTADEDEALDLIRKTCLDLGVENVFIAGRTDEVIDVLLDLSASQVNLPIDSSRTLILHGLPPHDRPLPIERLSFLIRQYCQEPRESFQAAPILLDYSIEGQGSLRRLARS
jgi:UDP-GlcNAc:undecaprenyl-phosphate/decaprenyl-phosphate GlcNAc-1-phosphate transferase